MAMMPVVEHGCGERAAGARFANASRKCSGVPAPPEAMTGTSTASTDGLGVGDVVAGAHAVAVACN